MKKIFLIIASILFVNDVSSHSKSIDNLDADKYHIVESCVKTKESLNIKEENTYTNGNPKLLAIRSLPNTDSLDKVNDITYCKLLYDIGWRNWVIEINGDKKSDNDESISYDGFIRLRSSGRKIYFLPESTRNMVSMVDSLFISKKVPIFTRTINPDGDVISSQSKYLDVLVMCHDGYEYNEKFRITSTYGGYDYVYSPTFKRLLNIIFLYSVLYLGPDYVPLN